MDEFHYYGDPDRGWAWQVPLLLLPRAQFVLMSATLGDVTAIADDLSRRTGRATARITGVDRPVPLHFSYARTPVHETVEELLQTGQAPVYIVHFSQAAAMERAQALSSVRIVEPRAARRDRRGDRRLPLHDGVRADAVALRPRGHRRAPRGHAAALPAARRDARPARPAARHLRHRHARRRHQRADPDGADHGAREVRRTADAAAQRPRVPPGRRAGGPGGIRHRRNGRRAWRPSTRSRTPRPSPRPATTRRSSARSCARRRRRGSSTGARRSFERLVAAEPEPLAPQLQLTAAMLINVIARGGDVFANVRVARLRQPRAAAAEVRTGAPCARHLPHAGRAPMWSMARRRGGGIRLTVDLQPNFALNQPLSPFALAAIGLLDPDELDAPDLPPAPGTTRSTSSASSRRRSTTRARCCRSSSSWRAARRSRR